MYIYIYIHIYIVRFDHDYIRASISGLGSYHGAAPRCQNLITGGSKQTLKSEVSDARSAP